MPEKICIVGQGAFGSALKRVYENTGAAVEFLGRGFSGIPEAEIVLCAVPTASVADVLETLQCPNDRIVVLCCKGILKNGALPSSLIPAKQRYAILSGPGYADELSALQPAVQTVAAAKDLAVDLARRLSTPTLRIYWSDDPVGVQICGAIKNILAIAAGLADGLSLGESARAALITRGLREMRVGLESLGGHEQTIWSAAGIGDLVLTCSSEKSRNFRFGQKLARGMPAAKALEELGTVEGNSALPGFLAAVPKGSAPIASALYEIIGGTLSPGAAVKLLMERPVTAE